MRPTLEGRRLSAEEFVAFTPEKMELVDGAIRGGEGLLLLLLTQFGLRCAADLVGHELWQSAVRLDPPCRG